MDAANLKEAVMSGAQLRHITLSGATLNGTTVTEIIGTAQYVDIRELKGPARVSIDGSCLAEKEAAYVTCRHSYDAAKPDDVEAFFAGRRKVLAQLACRNTHIADQVVQGTMHLSDAMIGTITESAKNWQYALVASDLGQRLSDGSANCPGLRRLAPVSKERLQWIYEARKRDKKQ
jgi:uncharacterized protein YjbI with pentapeptide repeats